MSENTSLKMSADNLFQYHGLLVEKAEKARKSGAQKVLDATLVRIDQIMMILDSAFYQTVEYAAPTMKIDLNMFDLDALSKALPGMSLKSLPMQTEIEFTNAEVVSARVHNQPKTMMEDIAEMLSFKFTDKISSAVGIFLKENPTLFPADAWLQIKDAVPENTLIRKWDLYIAEQYRLNGAIKAYFDVKKHLPNFDDVEIGRMIEDSLKRASVSKDVSDENKLHMKKLLSMKLDGEMIQAYNCDETNKALVCKILGSKPKDKVLTAHINRIAGFCTPTRRVELEEKRGRKSYVEQAYK